MLTEKYYQELLGQIVHSYNNFLSGAIGFNELALLDCADSEIAGRLQESIQSGRLAVEFGNELLSAVARLQVTLQPTDLFELLSKIEQLEECELVAEKNTRFITQSDPVWLQRCLQSVIGFCQIMSPGCKVTLRLSQSSLHESFFQLNIKPSPLELSAEQIEHLFEPFYSSRKLLGQKDVGLAVVYGFIQQMGGEICWKDQQGFVLTLPVVTDSGNT